MDEYIVQRSCIRIVGPVRAASKVQLYIWAGLMLNEIGDRKSQY